MKSEQRHRLETNVMAEQLGDWIDKLRPYATSVAGILLFVFIAMFAWSYMSSSSASSQNEAWEAYNDAVATPLPNLDKLRQSAEEHPGTKMQDMANVTWADGQVWLAAREFLGQRSGAMAALDQATSRYKSVLESSDDERLKNRARLGLARIYEMQNQLDKARAEYEKVTGGFAEFAKDRAKELGEKNTQEICAWLATAQLPRRPLPAGTGKVPAFTEPDVPLPNAGPAGASPAPGAAGISFDKLLQDFDLTKPSTSPDRYGTEKAESTTEQPAADAPGAEAASEKAGTEPPQK